LESHSRARRRSGEGDDPCHFARHGKLQCGPLDLKSAGINRPWRRRLRTLYIEDLASHDDPESMPPSFVRAAVSVDRGTCRLGY